jgi:hypothetical protein
MESQSETIIYIDFENDSQSQIIEMGAIAITNGIILDEFHCFINQSVDNTFTYMRCAENCHCIHYSVLYQYGITMKDADIAFDKFLNTLNKKTLSIKGHGNDVTKDNLNRVFPCLQQRIDITYSQVNLPNWETRQFEYYHLSAYYLKHYSNITSCNHDFHQVPYMPTWQRRCQRINHSKIAKLFYQHHCALVDAYEMAFYEKTLKHFCCDEHFSRNYLFYNKHM